MNEFYEEVLGKEANSFLILLSGQALVILILGTMMRLFGKPKQPPSPADAIQRLRETLDLLEKREKYLEKKIEYEVTLAKKNAKSNKRGTLNRKSSS